MPANDPVGTLVLGADARNIRGVLVGGVVRTWSGVLCDVDLPALRDEVTASRDAVLRRAGRAR